MPSVLPAAYVYPPVEKRTESDFLELGTEQERNGMLLDALSSYQEGPKRFPAGVSLHRALGRLEVALKQYPQAIEQLSPMLIRINNDKEASYNSSMANGACLVGPAIAGLLIGAFGEGWCFLIDGVSYFAVIASLLLIRIKPLEIRRHTSSTLQQMREGWEYVPTFRPIRTILLLFALVTLVGYSSSALLPVFATQVLHGGAATLGWLTGAAGIGALVSALSLAARKSIVGLTSMLQIASAMLGGALILFGLSQTLWLSLALMVLVGFGMIQVASVSNTIIQSLVPEDKRARVMSYYTMAFFGATPFGSLMAGELAHRIGAPHTVILTGAFCVVASLWFTFELPRIRVLMRPIYQQTGVRPARDIDLISDEREPAI